MNIGSGMRLIALSLLQPPDSACSSPALRRLGTIALFGDMVIDAFVPHGTMSDTQALGIEKSLILALRQQTLTSTRQNNGYGIAGRADN